MAEGSDPAGSSQKDSSGPKSANQCEREAQITCWHNTIAARYTLFLQIEDYDSSCDPV